MIASVALVVSRRDDLRSEAQIDALLSREVFFLLNNLVLILICVVIFWGTFFPLISEALTGTEESVGPPFFNGILTPLALVLVALAAIGPLLTWRRNSFGRRCAAPSCSRSSSRSSTFVVAARLHVGRRQRRPRS